MAVVKGLRNVSDQSFLPAGQPRWGAAAGAGTRQTGMTALAIFLVGKEKRATRPPCAAGSVRRHVVG
jgi:hypothetical protein